MIYLFSSSLRIYFDINMNVEFIEFCGGYNISLEAYIYGKNPFKIKENELFEILKQNNNGEIIDTENGYSYVFKNTSLSIYREAKPEELKEFINEVNSFEDWSKERKEKQILEETIKASYWETLGIGIENYYQ